MVPIFADASYWIAILHERDAQHEMALLLQSEFQRRHKITTEMVLVEVLNFFGEFGARGRQLAVQLVSDLTVDDTVDVIEQTSLQFWRAVDFYNARPDQEWGLVDCASFQIMAERNIREALTNDHHFTQAGFNILMQ